MQKPNFLLLGYLSTPDFQAESPQTSMKAAVPTGSLPGIYSALQGPSQSFFWILALLLGL